MILHQTKDTSAGPSLTWKTSLGASHDVVATGDWTVATVQRVDASIDEAAAAMRAGRLDIDFNGVGRIDTFGACLLARLVLTARRRGQDCSIVGLTEAERSLLDAVTAVGNAAQPRIAPKSTFASVRSLGKALEDGARDLAVFVTMLGAIGDAARRVIARPRTLRFTSVIHQLDRVAFQAIPIVLLITFLIGGIIAQQGIFNFRKFGADGYVVDLVGVLVLRELGVLIVAIMVAGRSGSSHTAELGSMKMREEVDALRTMGLDPVEVLILPRVIALVIGLPILTFLGSMAALVGGGAVAWAYDGMAPAVFVGRLRDAISLTHFEVGILKAPFMALMIGVVACAEGLRVEGSAESLGLRTTSSVVSSIFLVIVLDGLFAVFFASIGM